jgi:hypothetical protein
MPDIAEYMPSHTTTQRLAPTQSSDLPASYPTDNSKIRGFRLVLIWLAAILLSWVLAGSAIYGGFKAISLLLS